VSRQLTTYQFIDLVRASIGLRPLYAAGGRVNHIGAHGGYLRLESLRRAADPSCARCGGSGYYDGDRLEMSCPCTGLAQRAHGQGRKPGTGDDAFLKLKR
jgi:hypothetical protein